MIRETRAGTERTGRPGHGAAHRMKLIRQQIEAHPLGTATIRHGNTVGHKYKNYILSLMLSKSLCDQCPKLESTMADHVGPLA